MCLFTITYVYIGYLLFQFSFFSPVFGESDDIYITTLLGLDRGNNYTGAKVLILGGGDGGLLNRLVNLPHPPQNVIMAEVNKE